MAEPGLRLRPQTDRIFLRSRGFIAAVTDQLLAWHFVMESAQLAARNWAPGGQDATVIGAPVASDGYLSLKSASNFLRLGIKDPLVGTLVVVARATDTLASNSHRPIYLGNYNGVDGGASLYVSTATAYQGSADFLVSGGPTHDLNNSAVTGTPASWRMLTFDFGPATQAINNLTTGTVFSENQPANYTRVQGTQNLCIGSGASSAYQGTSDVALAAVYGKQLSAIERAALYDQVKKLLATRNVII